MAEIISPVCSEREVPSCNAAIHGDPESGCTGGQMGVGHTHKHFVEKEGLGLKWLVLLVHQFTGIGLFCFFKRRVKKTVTDLLPKG